jgi:hypothetical protein
MSPGNSRRNGAVSKQPQAWDKTLASKPETLYGLDRGLEKTAANYGLFGAQPCPLELAQEIAIDCKSTPVKLQLIATAIRKK